VLPDGGEMPFRMTMVQEHASIAVGHEEALGVDL
jgi:hypothetical protein